MDIIETVKQFTQHNPLLGVFVFVVGSFVKYRIDIRLQNSKILGFMQQVNEAMKTEHGFRDDVSSKQHDRIETLESRIYTITYDINKADKESKKAVDARIKRIEKTNSEYINIMKQELFLLKESIELLKRPKG